MIPYFTQPLLYFPDKVLRDPWILLRVWDDISSFGGILGGIAGARGSHFRTPRIAPMHPWDSTIWAGTSFSSSRS